MVIENRNDAILVKIYYKNSKDEYEYITGYYTTAIDQTLKMFQTCKDYEIKCMFNEFNESISNKVKSAELLIEDIWVTFGNNEDIPTISVSIV